MYHERLLKRSNAIYLTPDAFLADVVKYFEWVDDHPLLEEHVFQHKGAIVRTDKAKMRPYTKKGLATYLGIPESRLASYRNRGDEWAEAVELIEQVIYTQKFEGAAAGLLNAGIISRDLGLAEKQEVETTDLTPAPPPEVPNEHQAIHVHPDDPNPLNLPRPMYSQAQIDAGIPFTAPPHDAE
jgi:hypothetical protein